MSDERAELPIERLLPDPAPTTIAAEIDGYDPGPSPDPARPFVAVNFAATLDGRAAIGGRSGPIGSPIDGALLLRLRTRFDAVMVGAGTLRTERYGRIVKDPDLRAARAGAGLDPDPLAVILTRSGDIPWDAPIFECGAGKVLVITADEIEPPRTATEVECRCYGGSEVDLGRALRALRESDGVKTLLCEGGPHVHAGLQAGDLVDDLFLTLGPRIAGNDAPTIVEGLLDHPRNANLVALLRHEDELMVRYSLSG